MIPRLVDYSSDEEQNGGFQTEVDGDNLNENKSQKSKETSIGIRNEGDILPLPSEIKCMFTDNSENTVIDDPKKFDGKIRSFPHERGVWATYVYIEYVATSEFLEMVENLIKVSETHGITLKCVEDFHVSLSRTLKLRHHWIQSFIDSLKGHLSHLIKFKIMFQSLEVYENEDKTRTFIGLKVHFGFDYLHKITQKVDACLKEFKLPLFYENPSFHLSCVACVGSKSEQIELFMADLNAVFQSFAEAYPTNRTLWVTDISCKTGNKFFKIPLKS